MLKYIIKFLLLLSLSCIQCSRIRSLIKRSVKPDEEKLEKEWTISEKNILDLPIDQIKSHKKCLEQHELPHKFYPKCVCTIPEPWQFPPEITETNCTLLTSPNFLLGIDQKYFASTLFPNFDCTDELKLCANFIGYSMFDFDKAYKELGEDDYLVDREEFFRCQMRYISGRMSRSTWRYSFVYMKFLEKVKKME